MYTIINNDATIGMGGRTFSKANTSVSFNSAGVFTMLDSITGATIGFYRTEVDTEAADDNALLTEIMWYISQTTPLTIDLSAELSAVIGYANVSGTFAVGMEIIGSNSGGRATINNVDEINGRIYIDLQQGSPLFTEGEHFTELSDNLAEADINYYGKIIDLSDLGSGSSVILTNCNQDCVAGMQNIPDRDIEFRHAGGAVKYYMMLRGTQYYEMLGPTDGYMINFTVDGASGDFIRFKRDIIDTSKAVYVQRTVVD